MGHGETGGGSGTNAEAKRDFINSTGLMNPRVLALTRETPIDEFRQVTSEIDEKAETWLNQNGVRTLPVSFEDGKKGVQILPLAGASELNDFALKQMRVNDQLVVYSAEQQLRLAATASYRFSDHTTFLANDEIANLKPENFAHHEGRHANFGKRILENNPSPFSLVVSRKSVEANPVSALKGYEGIITLEEVHNYAFDLARSASTLTDDIKRGASEAGKLRLKKAMLVHEAQSAQLANEAAQKWIQTSLDYLRDGENPVEFHTEKVSQPGRDLIEVAYLNWEQGGIEFLIPLGRKPEAKRLTLSRNKAIKKLESLQKGTAQLNQIYAALQKEIEEFEPPYGPTNPKSTQQYLSQLRRGEGIDVQNFPVGDENSLTFITVEVNGVPRQISSDVYEGEPLARNQAIELAIKQLQKEEAEIFKRAAEDQASALKILQINRLARRARTIVQNVE